MSAQGERKVFGRKEKKTDFLTSFSNNSTEHTVVARIFRFALLNWDLKVHETEQRARVNVEKKWEILHEKIKKRRLQWIVRDELNLSAVSEKRRHVLTICECDFDDRKCTLQSKPISATQTREEKHITKLANSPHIRLIGWIVRGGGKRTPSQSRISVVRREMKFWKIVVQKESKSDRKLKKI